MAKGYNGTAGYAAGMSEKTSKYNGQDLSPFIRDSLKHDILDRKQELELVRKIKYGDLGALDTLVTHNFRFVVSTATSYQNRGMDMDELFSSGCEGLMKAAYRYDPKKLNKKGEPHKFISYAVWWIKQSIMYDLKQTTKNVREPMSGVSNRAKIEKTRDGLSQKLGREATLEEVSEECGIPVDTITAVLLSGEISLYIPRGDDEGFQLIDALTGDEGKSYESMEKGEVEDIVFSALSRLDERCAKILMSIHGFYGEEIRASQIARNDGVTKERIRQVKEGGLKELRKNKQLIKGLKGYLEDM